MSPANSEFYHRNITIKNSKFTNTGGSGIVLARCKDVLVEDNHFDGTGSDEDSRMWNRGSGLWTYTVMMQLSRKYFRKCIWSTRFIRCSYRLGL